MGGKRRSVFGEAIHVIHVGHAGAAAFWLRALSQLAAVVRPATNARANDVAAPRRQSDCVECLPDLLSGRAPGGVSAGQRAASLSQPALATVGATWLDGAGDPSAFRGTARRPLAAQPRAASRWARNRS